MHRSWPIIASPDLRALAGLTLPAVMLAHAQPLA